MGRPANPVKIGFGAMDAPSHYTLYFLECFAHDCYFAHTLLIGQKS